MSKTEFVKNLLKDKSINQKQREKVFELISRDFVISEKILNELKVDIQSIREKINNKGKSNTPKTVENKTSKIDLTYKCPKGLTKFLHEYNNNAILRYTCHKIDSDALVSICKLLNMSEYNFEAHRKAISNEYFKLQKKYQHEINNSIKGKIGEYLNNYKKDNKGWSEDQILVTWKSDDLLAWSKKNVGKCPCPDNLNYNGFEFPPIELKNGESLNNFKDIVLHFKKQIQFRESNSLKTNLEEVSFEFSNSCHFNFDEVRENIEFFTDTEKVKQAFRKIIDTTSSYFKEIEKTEKPFFKVVLVENKASSTIELSVHNTNSKYGKSLQNLNDRLGEKTQALIKLINGICDFSITADFGGQEYAEVNIWSNETTTKKINKFEGVKYNLIFYRSK